MKYRLKNTGSQHLCDKNYKKRTKDRWIDLFGQEIFSFMEQKNMFEPVPERIELNYFSISNGDITGINKWQVIKESEDKFTKEELKKMEQALNNERWTEEDITEAITIVFGDARVIPKIIEYLKTKK